ncbi:hypothetical protein [Promicromonospora sukumoe]|uniref:hypothetical protein n=1 Tax=Promicromonospora sukumoe TaxID=88382 RepID=UPI00365E8E31
MTVDYAEAFDGLGNVFLEDSWVLEYALSRNGLAFRIEVALLPGHALFQSPRPGEQHWYRAAWMRVLSSEPVQLELSGALPAHDAKGESDLGHIDVFAKFDDADRWVLEGDWGRAIVCRPCVSLEFD